MQTDHASPRPDLAPSSTRSALRVLLRAPDSYGLVLLLLLVSFILPIFSQDVSGLWARLLVQGATVIFVFHTSRVKRRTMRLAGLLVGLALLLALGATIIGGTVPQGAIAVLLALLFAVCIPVILRRILTSGDVGLEVVMGALDVYIIFGLLFTAVYIAIGTFSATPFFTGQAHVTTFDYQFFSFVTLTTVGYGNLVPAATMGQSLAVLEALLGQIYLVTLVARLVSGFEPGSRRRALERLLAEREGHRAGGNDAPQSQTDPSHTAVEPPPSRD